MYLLYYTIGMPKVFRLDKQPKSIAVTSTVFTGTNGAARLIPEMEIILATWISPVAI